MSGPKTPKDGGGYELPPDDVPRFAYEEAESILDEFAAKQDATYQRAYMKVKMMASMYAYADYFLDSPYLAMSRGWEELQIAFTGRGEAFLSGAVLHLYNSLPDIKAEKRFKKVVIQAFAAAEAETHKKARRLYMRKYRNLPLRDPDDGFTLEPVLPAQGVRLREWALKDGIDPDAIEEQFFWLEAADRKLAEDGPMHDPPSTPPRPGLVVLEGGKTSQGTEK